MKKNKNLRVFTYLPIFSKTGLIRVQCFDTRHGCQTDCTKYVRPRKKIKVFKSPGQGLSNALKIVFVNHLALLPRSVNNLPTSLQYMSNLSLEANFKDSFRLIQTVEIPEKIPPIRIT